MKKLLLAAAATAAIGAPMVAVAQAPAAPAATPEHTVTGNMAIVSDYRFRGISQTFGEGFFVVGPAIQGGIDYSHSSGIYLGNWNSNVSGNQYPNGSSIEMDFYGGWKHSWGDFGLDLGTIYYAYPGGTKLPSSFDPVTGAPTGFTTVKNWEIYAGGSWKWFSAKYFYSFTDYFGQSEGVVTSLCNPNNSGCTTLGPNGNTKGSSYLMGAFNYEVMPKLTFTATAGYTWVANYNKLDYFDYKVGLTYDLDGWLLGASIIGTDADKDYYYASNGTGKVREIGTAGLILSIGKTF